MINDISAGSIDVEMIPTIAKLNKPYVLMHMKDNQKICKLILHMVT